MGSCWITREIDASSASEAWDKVYAEAERINGEDPYGGDINTCCWSGREHILETSQQKNGMFKNTKQERIVLCRLLNHQAKEVLGPRDATVINCGRVGYRVVTLETKKNPRFRKGQFVSRWVVESRNSIGDVVEVICAEETKTEAMRKAETYIRKNHYTESVYISKKPYDISGRLPSREYEAEISPVTKIVSKKPQKVKSGTIVVPIYHFVVAGWAKE